MSSQRYIPTLDGWRAIAVMLVCCGHGFESVVGERHPVDGLWQLPMQGAALGVRVFFGLSGFLITSRLLEEEQHLSRIDLPRFYWRRIFRILPAAYTYLALIGVLAIAGSVAIKPTSYAGAAFFFINYLHAGTRVTAHYWSLAVEEHFYLFWPVILVLAGRSQRLVVGAALACAITFWRAVDFGLSLTMSFEAHYPRTLWEGMQRTDLCVDFLLWGSVVAVLQGNQGWMRRFNSFAGTIALASATAIALVIAIPPAHQLKYAVINALLRPAVAGIAIALLLVSGSLRPGSMVGRLLESPPLRWLGRLSYSLYLWQQLFLTPEVSSQGWLAFLQHAPFNIAAALGMALLSQQWVEKPLIRFGARWKRSNQHPAVLAR